MTEDAAKVTPSSHHGQWRWSKARGELEISIIPGDGLRDIGGSWSLDAFSLQLDGLSRARLSRTLEAGTANSEVACALGLSDGRRVRLIGRFETGDAARGDLVAAEAVDLLAARPGPSLSPAFQPIISLRTGQTAGFEALARWDGQYQVSDATFEDPALATNMLIQAAQVLSRFQAMTGRLDLFVQVNLTGRDLVTGGVAELVETLRQGYHLAAGTLKIELTEQAALRDADAALEAVNQIKAAGAGLVLDDFGSGHSSFAWLADMPADALKIDQGLTRRIGEPRTDHILEAITLLAGRLNMDVTAEGIEDRRLSRRLRALGFTHVQGFAFSEPLDAAAAEAFLRTDGQG